MTLSTLPISRLVNVAVNLSPNPAQMQNINNLLILGSSDVIDTTERLRNYLSAAAVGVDFGLSAPEYLAAVLWFQQNPQPATLSIGRWAQTATAAYLKGGVLSAANQAIAAWNLITTPGFQVTMKGVPYAISPASFAAATNLNGIATLIQTALAAAVAGTTCVWNSNFSRFEIDEGGTAGVLNTISFAKASSAVGTYVFAGQPANLDTITIAGTVVTFVTAAPVGSQVQINAVNLAGTLANLLTFLNASVDANLVKFTYMVDNGNTTLGLVAVTAGVGGNALTLAKSGANIAVSGATALGATAQDIATMLAMTATGGGYVAPGSAAETAVAAVNTFDNMFGQSFYAISICGAADADHLAVAAWVEAASNKHIYGVTTQESGVLNAQDTTNVAYQLQQLGYTRTMTQYSSSSPYACVSALARILTTNYNANNTVITLMWKQEPGIVPETLNATQVTALEGFNCNVFLSYNNNTAIFEPGKVASGSFLDITTGTDWLALSIQNAVYNLLYTSTTKIPQTDLGNHLLVVTIESVCSQGVLNGLLAPGVWTTGGFGALNQNDFMPKGFYVYAPPVSSQSAADRTARKSVPIQVAAKLAGAIHTVNVIVNVNR